MGQYQRVGDGSVEFRRNTAGWGALAAGPVNASLGRAEGTAPNTGADVIVVVDTGKCCPGR